MYTLAFTGIAVLPLIGLGTVLIVAGAVMNKFGKK